MAQGDFLVEKVKVSLIGLENVGIYKREGMFSDAAMKIMEIVTQTRVFVRPASNRPIVIPLQNIWQKGTQSMYNI